jgi:hypothetical protein
MTIILSPFGTASLSPVVICSLQSLQCHCQAKREQALTDLFPEFLVEAGNAARGAGHFSHLSAVRVVVGIVCLDAVQ